MWNAKVYKTQGFEDVVDDRRLRNLMQVNLRIAVEECQ